MSDFQSLYLTKLSNGSEHNLATTKPYVGFYFSAHWCPPCQRFTPKLKHTYEILKDKIEIIYCSSDHTDEQFQEYYQKMPWLCYERGDSRIAQLSQAFAVKGIPRLQIVKNDGTIITSVGVQMATNDPEGSQFPWIEKNIKNLALNAEGINEKPSVCILSEDVDISNILDELESKVKKLPITFYYADKRSDVTEQIRTLTEKKDYSTPIVMVLDCPDDGGYYVMEKPFTASNTIEFVYSYMADDAERYQMEMV